MRRILAAAFLLWAATVPAWAQSSDSTAASGAGASPQSTTGTSSASAAQAQGSTTSVEQRFDADDLVGKLAIVDGLSAHATAKDGPLLQKAFDYLVSNLSALRGEQAAQELGMKAAELIAKIDYAPAAGSMWQLFQFSDNVQLRLATIDALASVARRQTDVINKMNHWLAGQNLLFQTGAQVDPKMIDACVRALGSLSDASSFTVLFATTRVGYGEPITSDALHALQMLKGDRAKQYLQVVETGSLSARNRVLEMALGDGKLSALEKGTIATAALKAALNALSAGEGSAASVATLRYRSLGEIAELQWTPAADLVAENFNRAAAEYREGKATAKNLIESAEALTAMGTHEAAVRLTLYLDLINSMTDKGRPSDRSVTLAIIGDLGKLGDPVAYQDLLAVQYLDYPDSIKAAAREAVNNLED